jgi:tetratricopeptide (TPR) repeat protein
MPKDNLTETEIEAVETLCGQGDFAAALALSQEMLKRAQDGKTRMRLLFNVVCCSTRLNLVDITSEAARDLDHLPDSKPSRVFVRFLQALAYIEFGRAQAALDLLDTNLRSDLMDTAEFQQRKYEHLVRRGNALTRLARCDEALDSLAAAHAMLPDGKDEVDILITRSNCQIALQRYNEAYDSASKVKDHGNEEMATLAMQYMGDCRMFQSRVSEALDLYIAIRMKLPSRFVQREQIENRISNTIAYIEKLHPQTKPY